MPSTLTIALQQYMRTDQVAHDRTYFAREHIRTNARVLSVARAGFDKVKTDGREKSPFEIRYQNGRGPETLRADVVIDASGTWNSPNPGTEAIGEAANTS
jgi:hypothetical protein